MKPHPTPHRIRKTIKWGGAVVTVLLVVVWIGSGWLEYYWFSRGGLILAAGRGAVMVAHRGRPMDPDQAAGLQAREYKPQFAMAWMPRLEARGYWRIQFPLLIPASMTAALSAIAWRLDSLARRRARLNLCLKCNYDRAGIAADAKCPECGADQE